MNRAKVGVFLGIPYDWRKPTWSVIKERGWNPNDLRIFTPHIFGWGWSINFYQVFRKLRIIKQQVPTSPPGHGTSRGN